MNEAWIDLETTGTNELCGSIVEVGLIVVVDGRQVQEAEWLVPDDSPDTPEDAR